MKCGKWRTCDSIKEAKQSWRVCVWLCQARVGLFRKTIKAIWLPDEVFIKGQKRYIVFLMFQRNLSFIAPSLFPPSSCPDQCYPTWKANHTICRSVSCFRAFGSWLDLYLEGYWFIFTLCWEKMVNCWGELVKTSKTFWEAVVNQSGINQVLFT
jgi:hypothetical protein